MAKLNKNTLTVEHIDPRWAEGRDYQLVCGFSEGPLARYNEIIADHSYNSRKTNRFVPYRVCNHPAPITFGDIGEFLINGEWVVCEFGGGEWWKESNVIGSGAKAWCLRESSIRGGETTGRQNVENGHWATLQTREIRVMGGTASSKTPFHKIRSSRGGVSTSKQRWQCGETGFITNAGALTRYQRARGIDTSNRVKVIQQNE
jgi:hypothetical protein